MAGEKQVSDARPAGLLIGQGTADLIAFYGGTPIAQRSGASQAAVSTTALTAVSTLAAVTVASSRYGYDSQTQADNIPARINQIITRQASMITLVNELRDALVALNAIKGAS